MFSDWSTVVAGAIGASQFEELFILQSNSLDHVETAQRAANAGFTNHVDNPSMNQGMGHLHGMVIAAMVRPHHRRARAFWLRARERANARASTQMRAHFANSRSGDAHPEKASST